MEVIYDTYLVEIARDARLPESDQEIEQRGRLMTVSGVKSVRKVVADPERWLKELQTKVA